MNSQADSEKRRQQDHDHGTDQGGRISGHTGASDHRRVSATPRTPSAWLAVAYREVEALIEFRQRPPWLLRN